jgi:uncharacterized oligopeptide transporter (OPT) family protein
LFGGELPWTMIGVGAAVGALIIALDETLKRRGAKFRTPVLAAAVGIYLPLDLTMPIFLGGLLTWIVERRVGSVLCEEVTERLHRKGVLFSAGLITGEALMGIIIAIPIVLFENPDVLALPANLQFGPLVGLGIFIVIGVILYRIAMQGARDELSGSDGRDAVSGS